MFDSIANSGQGGAVLMKVFMSLSLHMSTSDFELRDDRLYCKDWELRRPISFR